MNILLWGLQIVLALYNLIGGLYMVNHYEKISNAWALGNLPKSAWISLGLFQILCALGLVIPKLTTISAVFIAVISLLGLGLYSAYAGFSGILWAIIPAILAIVVAFGRMR